MIQFIHDFSDIFLCLAKITHYILWENVTSALFIAFTVSFAYTRLYLVPLLGYTTAYEQGEYTDPQFSIAILIIIYTGLISLHGFWFVLILKMVNRALREKGVEQDIRSDGEEEEEVKQE